MSGIAATFSGPHVNTGLFANDFSAFMKAAAKTHAELNKPQPQTAGETAAPAPASGGGEIPGGTATVAPQTTSTGDATDTRGYADGAKPTPTSMTPSFISAAALPNYLPPPLQSNTGGKSLVGQ